MTPDEALEILDDLLKPKVLTQIQEFVFRQTWAGDSYGAMADRAGYDEDYIKDVGSRLWKQLSQLLDVKVSKNNVRSVFGQQGRQRAERLVPIEPIVPSPPSPQAAVDWGEAMEVFDFQGREAELQQLQNWIGSNNNIPCRLVAILGMGGIGKSAIAVKLVERLQESGYKYLIWRSLRNAPPLTVLLEDLLQVFRDLTQTAIDNKPPDLATQISSLFQFLTAAKCAVVLDNVETILLPGERVGNYRSGYQEYGDFFQQLAQRRHQSCVILTSREQPKEIGVLAEPGSSVYTLTISGLDAAGAWAICRQRGIEEATELDWQVLTDRYRGNPLALKIVSAVVVELFSGNLTNFLVQTHPDRASLLFDDIRDLLNRQFDRLSALEKQVMYWLAIVREFVPLTELRRYLIHPRAQQDLPDILRSLAKRSLIELGNAHTPNEIQFSQQPVVMEYVTERLIDGVGEELSALAPAELLPNLALLQAEAKDYIRQVQERLILDGIIDRASGNKLQIADRWRDFLVNLPRDRADYTAGNLVNLLVRLQADLSDLDLSGMTIWQAYLPNTPLHRLNLTGADLSGSAFGERLGSVMSVAIAANCDRLATGDMNGTIKLWEFSTGKPLLQVMGHTAPILGLVASENGQILASGSVDSLVKIWQVETGECTLVIPHENMVWGIALSKDGRWLVSTAADLSIRVWDTVTG
ncbi:NB-ARC domain-containing protein, partial [Chamaesiphon polymorphus]